MEKAMRAALIIVLILAAGRACAQPIDLTYAQGFESGTFGLVTYNGGTLERVPTGTGGLAAPQGQFFGRGLLNSSDGTTPGGGGGSGFRVAQPYGVFRSQLPPRGEYEVFELRESVKAFIDVASGGIGDWWAITTTHDLQRGFWFERASSSAWRAVMTYDTSAADSTTFASLSMSGWYTFDAVYTRGAGANAVDLRYIIRGPQGSVLFELARPLQLDPVAVAHLENFNWAVGWVQGGDTTAAVDDITISIHGHRVEVVPLPTAATLAGACLCLGMTRRRRLYAVAAIFLRNTKPPPS